MNPHHDWKGELHMTAPRIWICKQCGVSSFDPENFKFPCPPWANAIATLVEKEMTASRVGGSEKNDLQR